MKNLSIILIAIFVLISGGCGIREIPQAKNEVEASLAELLSQYKRRQDLVPNLVAVVQGYAQHEKSTLEAVISARARATQITIDPSKSTPELIQKFNQAQGELSQALGKLMVLQENYPQLKADATFRDLQAQLEGTENRVSVSRNRYIESVKRFNNLVTVIPTSWTNSLFLKYEKMPQWGSDQDAKQLEEAPKVKF